MSGNKPLAVHSDTKRLISVVVHRPDPGIEWVTPSNADSLLYDDIVFLPQMMDQHHRFLEVMAAVVGPEGIIEFQDLLQEILQHDVVRGQLLEVVTNFEKITSKQAEYLKRLPPVSLAAALISGLVPGINQPILPPLPNHIFTRDIGVVVNHSFITCIAGKSARKRESILAWFVAHFHPLFAGNGEHRTQFVDLCKDPQQLLETLLDSDLAIEGGDIMVIDSKNLFIGCSLRTNKYSIEKVTEILFEQQVVERVTMIDIPKHPNCIHLDTLFTQISEKDFVYYAPFLEGKLSITQFRGGLDQSVSYTNLHNLVAEIQPNVRLIPCGNGKYPYEEREQYASGCNFVALRNGVAVSYARNLKTLEALKERGYQIISERELMEGIRMGLIDPKKIKDTIIVVRSSELSRAGGGPHCLTLPLIRA